MKKHIFTLLLTLCLTVCFLPGTTLAADSDFIIENGVLIEYIGPGGKAIIPDGVTSIGAEAFRFCESLTSVTIPDSVTRIGDHAFYCCFKLTSVTIPDSVTSIGDDAFGHCDSLTSVTVPDSVTKIGSMAFSYCEGLTSAGPIGSNSSYEFGWTTAIPDHAFQYLPILASVTIPDSITSIGSCAFQDCKSLSSIIIPNSVTSIGAAAFSDCEGLTSVTIPNSVTSIGGAAFSGCERLTSVTIPNSVTSIGDSVFQGCTRLTSVGPIGSNSSSVTIPNSVTSIGRSAFSDCKRLTSVTIPDSVTEIGGRAFSGCKCLTSVTIPNSVTSIGGAAFSDCEDLTSVTIPDSVTGISDRVFEGCTRLTSVTVPDSVRYIRFYAFDGCTMLSDIYYAGSKDAWDQIGIFPNNEPLHNATIHYAKATVTFDLNGSTEGTTPMAQEIVKGAKATQPTTPARINYTFGGWFTDAVCTTPWNFDTDVNVDTTLYAKWTVNAQNLPELPDTPTPAPIMADPTNDALKVDGVSKIPTAYKIGGANYFLLRDVAMLLNGTKGQFSVDYDAQKQAVVIVTGQPYQPLGTELAGAAQSSTEAIVGNNDVYINGEKADLEVYKIGGANYFKIRDLGENLGFNVGWTQSEGMFIQSDKLYTDAD